MASAFASKFGRRQRRAKARSQSFGLEALEPRLFMDAAPVFINTILNQFVPANGNALTLGIDGFDADGDALVISAVSNDPRLSVFVPQTNRFARLSFTESDGVTVIGDIIIELLEDRVPENVERFITLATTGFDEEGEIDPDADPFYTDVVVHRVVPGFVIQTGDAENGNGSGGSPLPNFPGKIDPLVLSYAGPGVVGWANAGLGTNDSQFFITAGETDSLNSQHPILGHMVSGQDIYDDIINRPRTGERPTDPPLLKSVEIFDSTQDGTVTLKAAVAPGTTTTLYTSTSGTAPLPPTWIFGSTPGPGGQQAVSTFNGSYVLDTTSSQDIMAAQGVNPVSQPLTLNTQTGFDLSFNLRIIEENHSTADRAGFSFIAIGSDPTKSLEVAFWEDRIWVYDYDTTNDFTHGAEFMVDTTTFHTYTLRVENHQYTLLVDGEEALTGALEDYTGSRPLPAPYDVPNSVVFGDDTSRGSARVEVKSVVFRSAPGGVDNGDFDGEATVTLSLNDGHGNITTKNILVSTADLGARPTIGAVATQTVNPGATHTFDVTITDDQNADLDVTIATAQAGVTVSIAPKVGSPNVYTVTLTVPNQPAVFDVTITAVEEGFEDYQGITPTTRTFSVSTVGAAPTITGLPTQLNMGPGQVNVFNVTIADDQNAELDVFVDTDEEDADVDVTIEPVNGFPNLYQVRVELPADEHVYFTVTVGASEALLDRSEDNPRTRNTFIVSTLGSRPTIADPGEQRVAPGGTVNFTAGIQDDTGAPLRATIHVTEEGVTAEIDPETFEVTIQLPPTVHKHFTVEIRVLEEAAVDELTAVSRTFRVTTLGDRPVIADTGTIQVGVGGTSMFTPTITDDTGIPLTLSVTSSTTDVTVAINQETHQITFTQADENYRVFTITVRAVETGFTGLTQTTRTFTVVTGLGVAFTDATADTYAVAVLGNSLYVANGVAGVKIFDITNPAAIVQLGQIDQANNDIRDLRIVGSTLYAGDFTGSVVALDVSNPANIVELDRFATGGQVRGLLTDAGQPNVLYVAAGTAGLIILDITNAADLTRLSTVQQLNRNERLNDASGLALQDEFLFVGDRAGGIEILDVSNPTSPRYRTSIGKNVDVPSLAISDERLYVIETTNDRVSVFDIRRPTRPERIGFADLDSEPNRLAVRGNTAIIGQNDGYILVDATFPEFMLLDRNFESGPRGMAPLLSGDQLFLPVRDGGQVAIVDASILDSRITFQKNETVIDNNGVEVRVKVSGPGTVVIDTAENGHIELLEIFGTTDRSTVTITTDGGETTIDEIFISGFLKKLMGEDVNIATSLRASAFVNSIRLKDLDSATVTLGFGLTPRQAVSLIFEDVLNSAITSSMPIKLLDVVSWLDNDATADLITAPHVVKLIADGNFQAGLTLNGSFGARYTLGSATLDMNLAAAIWNITGDVKSITAKGTVDDFELNVMSNVSKITLGDVIDAEISVEDKLSNLTVDRWQAGTIEADELGRLRVTGNEDTNLAGNFTGTITAREMGRGEIAGNLDATITLTQVPGTGSKPAEALDRLEVQGAILDTILRSASAIDRITAGAIRNSTIFAGVKTEVTTLPDAADDFNAMVAINRLEITGLPDVAADFVNTNIAAWLLDDVRLLGVQNGNGGTPFGLATHTLGDLSQEDLAPGTPAFGGGGEGNDSVIRLV